MGENIVYRVLEEAQYIIETKKTIREIALAFYVSKSTVHKDLSSRLLKVNMKLYDDVKKILDYHTNIRHIRGGESTKNKYLNLQK